ncbi:MAG: quinone oxidoreductase [Acidobacteria bacterium]|nr:quinone oxidoreductase [Acidobacteriota bacterium]MBI3472568.1 quinone oxidoreductase [Candidatus Solibacter usitatus]
MKAIQAKSCGSPDVMQLVETPMPSPGPGQALVKIAAIGVNYIDVYFRTGLYKADLPLSLGMEASGVVEAVGEGVTVLAPGDRVAYAMCRGSYAEYAVAPVWQLVKTPDNISHETAAAAMLQGMTAHYLTHSTFALGKGNVALVHAAAGGAGLIIVQMAKALGATVIGTVSTPAKAALARQAGADEVILYTEQDFESEVKRLTLGIGVDVVYDSVGQATFLKGLNCLRPRGMMALFGQSSGPVSPIDPTILNTKGSLLLTRPSLAHYAANKGDVAWRAGGVYRMIGDGRLKIRIEKTYRLAEAAQAHRDLEGRRTAGKLLLMP